MRDDISNVVTNILNNCDSKTKKLKLILWIGAGIDDYEPTCLPLGNELAFFLLENSCTSKISQRFKGKNETFKENILENIYGTLRLESIIECFQQFENSKRSSTIKTSFMDGFLSFRNAEPNDIHTLAAKLLMKGANIVTTNYDLCIPKAYSHINGNDEMRSHHYCNGYYKFTSAQYEELYGSIYYIHGVASDISTLGATLTKLKDGLASPFREQLVQWMHEGYTFLFLGYGAGDSLDVNPFFLNLKERMTQAEGIYIQHRSEVGERSAILSEFSTNKNVNNLLQPFGKRSVIEINTATFMNNFEDICCEPKSDSKKWKTAFLDRVNPLNEEERLALSVQLCVKLGIRSDKVLPRKWWANFRYCCFMDENYILFYGSTLGRQNRNRRVLHYFAKKENATALEKSEYWASFYQYKRAAEVFEKPAQIKQQITGLLIDAENKSIKWDLSSAVNRWIDYILIDTIQNPLTIWRKIKKHRESALDLIDTLECIIENIEETKEVTQYLTAKRSHSILTAIFKADKAAKECLEKVKQEYQQISYTTGVIGTLSMQIICSTFLYCYREEISVRKIIDAWGEMLRMIMENHQYYYLFHFAGSVMFSIWGVLFGRLTYSWYRRNQKG